MNTNSIENIPFAERIVRLMFSLALVMIPFMVEGSLGNFALLPLFGIYPGLTSFIGYDPLIAVSTALTQPYALGKMRTRLLHPTTMAS